MEGLISEFEARAMELVRAGAQCSGIFFVFSCEALSVDGVENREACAG